MDINLSLNKGAMGFRVVFIMLCILFTIVWNGGAAFSSDLKDVPLAVSAEATAGKELIQASEGRILFYQKDTGLYGFLDEEGAVVVPPIYDNAAVYSDGLAWVEMRGEVSLLDLDGEQVILAADVLGDAIDDPYAEIYSFQDGLARVNTSHSTGYINQSGEYVIPLGSYYDGHDFSGGLAQVFDEGYKALFIDTTGQVLFEADPTLSYYGFVNDRALVYSYETEQYGYVDKFGSVLIKPQLDNGYSYTGPYAVYDEGGGKGIIDRNGFFVLWPGFEKITTLPSGMIGVYDGVMTTFLNKKAEPVYAIPKDQTGTMYDTFFVRYERDQYVFRDYAGNELLKLEDYWSLGDGLIESGDGTVYSFRHVSTDVPVQAQLTLDNAYTYSFVNDKGQTVLNLSKYDRVEPFREGRAKVELNGLFGYIDTAGSLVIPVQFTRAGTFYNGQAEVADENGGFTININGEVVEDTPGKSFGYYTFVREDNWSVGLIHESSRQIVLAPEYESITDYGAGLFLLMNSEGLYGWYNATDKVVVAPQYKDIYVFSDQERIWTVEGDRQYILRNISGERISDQSYEAAFGLTASLFEVMRDGKVGVVDLDGNTLIEPLYETVTYHADYPDWCAFRVTGFGEEMLYTYQPQTQELSAPLYGDVKGYNRHLLILYEQVSGMYIVTNPSGQELYSTTDRYCVAEGRYALFEKASGSEYVVSKDGARHLYQSSIPDLWLPVYENYILMSDEDGYGVVSLTGNSMNERRYDDVGPIQDGVFAYYNDGRFGYATVDGAEIIEEDQYVFVHSFSSGLGLVVERVSK